MASQVIRELWDRETGVLTPQLLQEFYTNVTRKISHPLSKSEARGVVHDFATWCADVTRAEIAAAFRIEDEARIGFSDALIVAAALKCGANLILSEHLNPGRVISGVCMANPFLAPLN
ncbi:MAG TPA: PIN domain-containing protein [Bryobacteraceae bacterium]|nr:PIN domain-containing protein [Bryobacteraceae bacterium]